MEIINIWAAACQLWIRFGFLFFFFFVWALEKLIVMVRCCLATILVCTYGFYWTALTTCIILRHLTPCRRKNRFDTFHSLIMTYLNISTSPDGAETHQWEFTDLNVELCDFCLCNSRLTSSAFLVALQVDLQPVSLQLWAWVEAVVDVHTWKTHVLVLIKQWLSG